MRHLKFRAWDKKRGTFVENIAINLNGEILPPLYEHPELYGKIMQQGYEFDPIEEDKDRVILMQYTGLKDKNGKKIYEGDILWAKPLDYEGEGCVCEVVYEAPGLTFRPVEEVQETHIWTKEAEIIGNIYENPELLKT